MKNQEIEKILSESGAPCISIIVPTHRLSPDRAEDPHVLKNAVKAIKDVLKKDQGMYDCNVDELIARVDAAIEQIDYTHCKDGIGIYVSPNISKTILFPFPVKEKVKVGDIFDSRDLLYYMHAIIDYRVLSISKTHVHLFAGKGEELRELKNEDFPIDYEEVYEYSKPSRGTSFGNSALKEFEKDKSQLQEIRVVDFLRSADHILGKYLNNHVPLVVSGGKKEIADYLQITQFSKNIIGKVVGNYNFNGDVQLANLSWEAVQRNLSDQNRNLRLNLGEFVGKKMLAIGIEEVWKAAKEGKGLELSVEKDFEYPGFIGDDGYTLKLHKPSDTKKYDYKSDVVETIIKTVREKGGRIVFMNNGELKDFGGIALQLRYNGTLTF